MRRALIMLGVVFSLAGCMSPEERAARAASIKAADKQECLELGFRPESENFALCMLHLREIRTMEQLRYEYYPPLDYEFGYHRYHR